MSKQATREQRGGDKPARRSRSVDPEAMGHRHERLSRILREEIEAVVRDELADPRLDGVRITTVELSVDYKNARVGFVGPDGAADRHERDRMERLLERATPFLRNRLVDAIEVKQVPALRFAWDAYAAAAPEQTE